MSKKLFHHGVITQEELNTLLSCIQASETYLRYHYSYNIKLHDQKAEHCAKFALSSPTETAFQEVCTESHTHHQCHHCTLVDQVFAALKNALQLASTENLMDAEDLDNFDYDLTQHLKAVQEFRVHAIRAFNQNYHWEEAINKRNPKQVFITMDWAMVGKSINEAGWQAYFLLIENSS